MKWLRTLGIWIGPAIIVLLMVIGGFLYWVLASSAGTRWALVTAAQQFDGEVRGVRGSVWHGLEVDHFSLSLPELSVSLDGLTLRASWPELLDRRLHVQELSADAVRVAMTTGEEEPSTEPFQMPALPVRVAVDRFALGSLDFRQDGNPLPVSIGDLAASVYVENDDARLFLESLHVGHEQLDASFEGEARALALQDPWPLEARLATKARGLVADSPLCARRFVPTLPTAAKDASKDATETASPEDCSLVIETTAKGSLDALHVVLKGSGQDMSLDADLNLAPKGPFPLKDALANVTLADGSSLKGRLDWRTSVVDGVIQDRVEGSLDTDKLNIGQLVGPAIPDAILTLAARFDVELRDHNDLRAAALSLDIGEGSAWNRQPLSGHVKTRLQNTAAPASIADAAQADDDAPSVAGLDWRAFLLPELDVDLRLGKNHVAGHGTLGLSESHLELDVQAPVLSAFWPDLPGGAQLKGEVHGAMAAHKADVRAQYTPADGKRGELGSAPVDAHVAVEGAWDESKGWSGTVQALQVDHADFGIQTRAPTKLSFVPGAHEPDWQWQVGETRIDFLLSGSTVFTMAHGASRGRGAHWETRGDINRLALTPALITQITEKFDLEKKEENDRGGVSLRRDQARKASEIVLALGWDMKFDGGLQGSAQVRRVSGDIMVPAEPSFPLGLEDLTLDLTAKREGAAVSRINADLKVRTEKMGRIAATATTLLHATPGGGMRIEPKDIKRVHIDADVDDLGWTSLFLGDAMELGGAVQARVDLESRPDGSWNSKGDITGQKLRVIRIDDGVRLLDGTLAARLDGERVVLDKLSFPALLRVTPKEWRTAEWVGTNPDAKGGSLVISGDWNVLQSRGTINAELHRYPILQRSDRYAMMSGKLVLKAELPKISITGKLTADAGWFDLDMLGGIPTVDGDVVVIRPGQKQKEPSAPMDVSMDIEVDLGPRFYLTGYGVNSGLVGQMRIIMADGRLSGIGALRTRGGAIETYGQRLQLRRGTITFQGDITSPVLDIEALRTGLAVEAGVRVAGTAKRPRIDLVSYPAVSEIEKLSWLLFGHGPDSGGGDVALLFSVGSSFLGDGEPFYRKFGIDEVSMRSGELGAAGSILPVESVVSGLDSGTSDIERKFVQVSKQLSRGFTVSIQQALSDTGTVGRISYQLARGLTAELTAGTVNGLALVYRWFSRN
ncbi:translocation/assembly module TamB domain-containing protein [Alcaligenaceae bacterium]|nr:translocation/assembly module TamB domain-containing protein [Alcaligenaceae bacterium]